MEKGLEPLFLLGLGAVFGEHLHVAPIRRIAVENGLGPEDPGHGFEDVGDLDIGEARTPRFVLRREEEVPKSLFASLCAKLGDKKRRLP